MMYGGWITPWAKRTSTLPTPKLPTMSVSFHVRLARPLREGSCTTCSCTGRRRPLPSSIGTGQNPGLTRTSRSSCSRMWMLLFWMSSWRPSGTNMRIMYTSIRDITPATKN